MATMLIRLDRLALIDSAAVPQGSRKALEAARRNRSALLKNAVGARASAFFNILAAAGYGIFGAFAWIGHAPIWGMFLSMMSAALILFGRWCAKDYRREREVLLSFSVVTPQHVLEAEAEQALADAVWDLNARTTAWNEAAALARIHAVPDALALAIDTQRKELLRKAGEFDRRLRVFNAMTQRPRPRALPPPSDWGHVVPISLESP